MGKKKLAVSPEPPTQSWIVRVTCTVVKELVCDDCTEEEARDRPWDFNVGEMEIETIDWDVTDVRPND